MNTENENKGLEFIGMKETANLLSISVNTLRNMVSQKRITHYKPTKNVVFKRSEVLNFIEASKIERV